MNKNLLRYGQFIKENAPAIKPAPTTTPAPTAPPMPSIIPTERPSEEDEPMAGAEDLSMNQPATKPAPTTTPAPTAPPMPSIVPTERPSEEDEPMASLGDLHNMFADDQHGAELMDNILNYRGIEVEVPSETGSYMVGGKNLKTKDAQKAYDYVQAQVQTQDETEDTEAQAYAGQNELVESKSYSTTRKFNRRTKK
jgi:hypothetical protein